MDEVQQLGAVLPSLSSQVDRMWHGQLEAPMPYGGSVHQALDRLMVMGATYTHWLRGEAAPTFTPPFVYGWVPAAEFREIMDDLLDAASEPGAQQRMLDTPMGTMNGAELTRVIVVGAVLAGRDLAVATGRTFDVDAQVMRTLDPFAAA